MFPFLFQRLVVDNSQRLSNSHPGMVMYIAAYVAYVKSQDIKVVLKQTRANLALVYGKIPKWKPSPLSQDKPKKVNSTWNKPINLTAFQIVRYPLQILNPEAPAFVMKTQHQSKAQKTDRKVAANGILSPPRPKLEDVTFTSPHLIDPGLGPSSEAATAYTWDLGHLTDGVIFDGDGDLFQLLTNPANRTVDKQWDSFRSQRPHEIGRTKFGGCITEFVIGEKGWPEDAEAVTTTTTLSLSGYLSCIILFILFFRGSRNLAGSVIRVRFGSATE